MHLNVFLSAVLGMVLAASTIKLAKNGLEPWSDMIIDICLDPGNTHAIGNLRVVYSGVSEALDRALCILVNYNQSVFHHSLGIYFQRLLMGATASVMAIMAIESSRHPTSLLLGLYPVLLFFANNVGISVIFSAIWMPVCLCKQSQKAIISRSRAFGILTAILVGFGLPACYLTSSLVPPNSEIEQNGLAIWQFVPFLVIPLFYAFEQAFEFGSSYADQVADKSRHSVAAGRDASEKAFILLGVLNMFIYQGSLVMAKWSGIHLVDALAMLLKAPGSLPAGLSFTELGQILSTRTALLDYISLAIGFVIWAGFSSGLRAAITVVGLSFVTGPGAAGCFYAYYREGCIQDEMKITYTMKKMTTTTTETITSVQ